jgi:hypothetical protein
LCFVRSNESANIVRHVQQLQPLFLLAAGWEVVAGSSRASLDFNGSKQDRDRIGLVIISRTKAAARTASITALLSRCPYR